MNATHLRIEPGTTINVLDHGFVRYIDHLGTDQRIVEAARVSYKSPSKGVEADKKLLTYLWRHKHTSPFEMAKITLNVKLPIFVMRQWVRHRMQNLNEVSARYTQLPAEFYIPDKWRRQDNTNRQGSVEADDFKPVIAHPFLIGHEDYAEMHVRLMCNMAYETYERMIAAGVAREMARMVLPVNIYTEMYCCWDLKNLLHFITLREDAHAQAEIQDYARAIKSLLVELFPWTMEAFDKIKFNPVEK